ncbi:rubrerythrin family protein [Desulfuribacillus alkaliarsenatis]|uniref:Rubrerythrin n=1 Tax=Desulfuribacillus alkaliarsenatis TaxID=766136 RepID=A0A1E5G321_9FIRM|nr:rubrerythrin family protein [Desulfuribacillus alkaliarsenatis]OEF97475.1 rubrerythrin [Desulfuribacillus alkaliarsenatis]
MNTDKHLKEAFAGESQANRKYLAFAKKAEQEGYIGVAKLFRAAAEAETVHAHNHLKALGGIKSTAENLKEGFDGEMYEFDTMYPPMLDDAKNEGRKDAERSFLFAMESEKVHADLYKDALENLDSKEDVDYYLCPICGYIEKNSTPDSCPICKAKSSVFVKY